MDTKRLGSRLLALGLALAVGCASAPREATPPRPEAPARAPACVHCGSPLAGATTTWRGETWHRSCFEAAGPRCGICDRVLSGPTVGHGRDSVYHEECLRRTPRCDGCSLPAGGRRGPASTWDDGRATCAECRATAVHLAAQALEVLAVARSDLERVLPQARLDGALVPVRLVDRAELARLAGDVSGPGLKAFTQVEVDGATGRPFGFRIFALYGLSRATLYGALAHELFHVAQSLRGTPHLADPALREGSANWVQWRLLVERGETEQAELLLGDADPIYGGGLRRFRKLVAALGERAAVDLALRETRFPDGT